MAPEDSRFARLQTDPRFRRTKQKNLKVEIDDRFKDVLQSEEFGGKGAAGKGRVDKRGRKLGASHGADQLRHFYRLKSPEAGEAEGGEKGFVDYARGEGVLESSGSEGEDDDEEDDSDVDEDELELGPRKAPAVPRFLAEGSDAESADDSDDEEHLNIDLSEDDEPATVFPDEDGAGDEEEEEEEYAEPTKRIAAVNLDWDNLRAGDLFTIFNSFLKPSGKNGESSTSVGKLLSVKIYPSEFGKKRLEMEEREGPGGGVFVSKKGDKAKSKSKKKSGIQIHREEESGDEDEEDEAEYEEIDEDDYENEVYEPSDDEGSAGDEEQESGDDDDEDEDQEDYDSDEDEEEAPRRKGPKEIDGLEILSDVESDAGSEDIDMDQLRQYQLERLRYWYAVATFSTVPAAMRVLAECNGAEFEMTANMFDLSYVPDDMEFDEAEIKDEATKEPKAYKGNDFVTDALRHSKVKLTWDQDDPNRSKLTRRNLTKDQIEEEDFKAYLASSGSESEGDAGSEADVAAASKAKKGKKGKKASKSEADKLRALLLNGDDEDGDVWGKAGLSAEGTGKSDKNGDMEITFRPGLSAGGALGNDDENLTTLEKYQMRMKEKKARKKEKAELKRAEKDDAPSGSKAVNAKDDFFGDSDDESDAGGRALDIPDTLPEDERAPEDEEEDVRHVLGDAKGVEHFSMKDVLKAEKEGGKKKRSRNKKKKHAEEREVELGKEGWKIDVKDERFKALHEEPEFAIDPSNPHFVKTKAMTDLLAERKNRKGDKGDRPPVEKGMKRTNAEGSTGEKDLSALVQSVKRKVGDGAKKPRKRSRK